MRYLYLLLSVFFMLINSFQILAQEEEKSGSDRPENSYYHQKGAHVLNIGTGLITNPTKFSFDLFSGGSGSGKPSPAINISYEYGLTPQIGVGALVGYYRVNAQQELSVQELLGSNLLDDPICLAECLLPFSIGGSCDCGSKNIEERINVFTVAGKLSYHFLRLPKLDTYSNITLGYSFNRRKTLTEEALGILLDEVRPNTDVPTFVYYVSVGARYFFNPNIAAFGEFGYSNVHLLHLGISYRW